MDLLVTPSIKKSISCLVRASFSFILIVMSTPPSHPSSLKTNSLARGNFCSYYSLGLRKIVIFRVGSSPTLSVVTNG
jgi:hypothetical protein